MFRLALYADLDLDDVAEMIVEEHLCLLYGQRVFRSAHLPNLIRLEGHRARRRLPPS